MLVRFILLGFLFGGIVYAWNKWRGPKLLRVPIVWLSMGRRHLDLAEALRLRRAIGLLLLEGSQARAASVLKDIDDVIKTLVQLARTREARKVDSSQDPVSQQALLELEALYEQIRRDSKAETTDKLDAIRARLAVRTADLKSSTEVRKEIEHL